MMAPLGAVEDKPGDSDDDMVLPSQAASSPAPAQPPAARGSSSGAKERSDGSETVRRAAALRAAPRAAVPGHQTPGVRLTVSGS